MSETTNNGKSGCACTAGNTTDDRAECTVEEERKKRIETAACKAYKIFVGLSLKYKEAYRACEMLVGMMGKSQLMQVAEVDERLAGLMRMECGLQYSAVHGCMRRCLMVISK